MRVLDIVNRILARLFDREIEVEVSLTQAQWDLGTADVLLTEAGSGRVLSRAPVALRLPLGGGCG